MFNRKKKSPGLEFDELLTKKKERKPSSFGRYFKGFIPWRYLLKKNKNEPSLDPKSEYVKLYKEAPSLDPKSEYVKLYKEALKSLIGEKGKQVDQLSIYDCKFIRNSLPDKHVYNDLSYDHLFAKYFLKKRKYTEENIGNEIDIFLYLELELYNILKRKTIKDDIATDSKAKKHKPIRRSSLDDYLLQKEEPLSSSSPFIITSLDILTNNIDHRLFMKGKLSIYNIMSNLCQDIRDILYINITNLNQGNILKVKTNLKVLKFVYDIYKVANFDKKVFTDDLYSIFEDKGEKFGKQLRLNKGDKIEKRDKNYGMLFIYRNIIASILKYDKVQKSLYLKKNNNDKEYNELEKKWEIYEENELAYEENEQVIEFVKLSSITKTLEDMNFDQSNFEINKFFNIMIKIYENIIFLYDQSTPNKEATSDKVISNKLKDILILSMQHDDNKKLKGLWSYDGIEKDVEDVEDIGLSELKINDIYSLYLSINLGNNDLPILFSYNKNDPGRDIINYEESIVFNIPIFNCINRNDTLFKYLNVIIVEGVFIVYDKLIQFKGQIKSLNFEKESPETIYKRYVEFFKELFKELKQSRGGRKKRIIKSKKIL